MSEGEGDAPGTGMPTDSLGLAYEARGGRIFVHYPLHGAEHSAGSRYGTGFDLGPIPSSYWNDPPNDITRERVELWRTLLERDLAASP